MLKALENIPARKFPGKIDGKIGEKQKIDAISSEDRDRDKRSVLGIKGGGKSRQNIVAS